MIFDVGVFDNVEQLMPEQSGLASVRKYPKTQGMEIEYQKRGIQPGQGGLRNSNIQTMERDGR